MTFVLGLRNEQAHIWFFFSTLTDNNLVGSTDSAMRFGSYVAAELFRAKLPNPHRFKTLKVSHTPSPTMDL